MYGRNSSKYKELQCKRHEYNNKLDPLRDEVISIDILILSRLHYLKDNQNILYSERTGNLSI